MLDNKDGIPNTIVVAVSVCLVCSLLVSAAAVGLKGFQDKNRRLDVRTNIVRVAGFSAEEIEEAGGIKEIFEARIEPTIIDLETGEEAIDEVQALFGFDNRNDVLEDYDQFKAAKDSGAGKSVPTDFKGLGDTREKYSFVYLLKDKDGNVSKYIFPIRGRGLWSTLKGFISLETDFQTVGGITYYEHGETPGLGGEVDNPNWKARWVGKKVYADGGVLTPDGTVPVVELEVVKGSASSEFGVDGLAGATITARGVSDMIQYWLGKDGFGPFIARQKQQAAARPEGANLRGNSDSEGASDG